MKTAYLLTTALLISCSSYSQLVFEITEPADLRGVYPSMAPDTNWNTPDLYQNGNWYTDTLLLADDGTPGSACSALTNSVSGQFVLFDRSGCDIGQSLINAQNAGATGALIIDTVTGRPLPFLDSVYAGATIPFIIISKDEGDSLKTSILNGNTSIVSFGDKTGISANDVGIYMETSWWSMYGQFPYEFFKLPDSVWGSWVYNHGTDTASNIQLRFYIQRTNDPVQSYQDTLSAAMNILPQDSVYVELVLPIDYTSFQTGSLDTIKYGYSILSPSEIDTLDNSICNKIIGTFDIISTSFFGFNNLNPEIDGELSFEEPGYLLQKYTFDNSPYMGYLGAIGVALQNTPGFCQYSIHNADSITSISELPWNAVLATIDGGCDPNSMCSTNCIGLSAIFGDAYTIWTYEYFNFLLNTWFENGPWSIPYTTEMYHDMRKRADSTFFTLAMDTGGANYMYPHLDPRITPLQYMADLYNYEGPYCGGGLEEHTFEVNISPNPATSLIYIESDETFTDVAIHDFHGRSIFHESLPQTSSFTMNNTMCEPGIYFITLISATGQSITKKIIIQ